MLREEFSRKCLATRFHRADAFCTAQWQWPRAVFVVYRLLMSSYLIFGLIHTLVMSKDRERFLAYLTIWTYLIEISFFLTGTVLAVFHCYCPHCLLPPSTDESSERQGHENTTLEEKMDVRSSIVNFSPGEKESCSGESGVPVPGFSSTADLSGMEGGGIEEGNYYEGSSRTSQTDARSLPWYVQLHWVLANIVQVFAPVVTVIFFAAVGPTVQKVTGETLLDLDDIDVHALNTAMVLVDMAVSSRPVRLLHVLHPVIYGVTYVIFSVIFWAQDRQKNVLYPNVLDWNHPGISIGVVLGLALVGIPLLQLAYFGLYQLRLKLYHFVYGEPY